MIRLLLRLLRLLFIIACLVLLGLIVGVMVVILPPLAWIGVIGLAALLLLWVLPDIPIVNHRLVIVLFFVAFTSQIIFPSYYAFAAPGLPWISLRRLTWFPMALAFSLLIATSAAVRAQIAAALGCAKPITIALIVFGAFQFFSIFTSISFSESLKEVSNALLYWYVAVFAAVYCLSREDNHVLLFRIIVWVCIIAGILGIAEFVTHQRFIARLWPESMIMQLFAANPEVFDNITRVILRGGQFRANFIYNVSLSYGEFMAMGVPISLYFALHGGTRWRQLFGVVATIASIAGVYVSGSRGAMLGAGVALPLALLLWIVRSNRQTPGSMVPALTAVIGILVSVVFVALFVTSTRFKTTFTGGAESVGSTDARFDQWRLAVPKILANPVTGHGAGLGGDIVGYAPFGSLTVDSYVISLLVEIGVPGFLAFFAMICYATYFLIKIYLYEDDDLFSLSGPLAAAFVSFGLYRLVLSQRENHVLFFVLIGMAIVQIAAARGAQRAQSRRGASATRAGVHSRNLSLT